jgi:hypothetical protein
MQPWAKAAQAVREGKEHQDDPLSLCLPPGVPRINMSTPDAPHPFKILQTPALLVLLYETSANSTFRQVSLDGWPLPKGPQPSWLGYSVGRWNNDTLVVETTGFNGRSWTDTAKGHPQTDAARATERFRRRDFGHLEIEDHHRRSEGVHRALDGQGAGQAAAGYRSDRNLLREREGPAAQTVVVAPHTSHRRHDGRRRLPRGRSKSGRPDRSRPGPVPGRLE